MIKSFESGADGNKKKSFWRY